MPLLACPAALAWVAEHLVEVAAVSAACGALAVAAVVALMRWADRRDARRAALGPLMVTRAAATALSRPEQVTRAEVLDLRPSRGPSRPPAGRSAAIVPPRVYLNVSPDQLAAIMRHYPEGESQ